MQREKVWTHWSHHTLAKMYASTTKKTKSESEENGHYEDQKREPNKIHEDLEDQDDKFHYIIDETQTKQYRLPEFIELTNFLSR